MDSHSIISMDLQNAERARKNWLHFLRSVMFVVNINIVTDLVIMSTTTLVLLDEPGHQLEPGENFVR